MKSLFSIFRPPVKISHQQMSLTLLVSASFMVAGYDLSILGLALPRIAPDLGIASDEFGQLIALVRLGIFPAFVLAAFADRFGRKTILAVTIIGSALFTLLTATAETSAQFIFFQAMARMFGYAQDMIAIVMISEEVDDRARGWALGLLAALGAAGAGLAAGVYAGVDVFFGGWRALYVFGALPLFLIAWLWRRLPETQRFLNLKEKGGIRRGGAFGSVRGIIQLFTLYPARSIALSALVFVFAFGAAAVTVFTPTFLQEERGFAPGHVSILVITGGAFALLGNFVAGRMSDRFGRRTVFSFGAMMTAGGFAFFYAASNPVLMLGGWVIGLFGLFAAEVVLSAFGAELYPTANRSSGSGLRTSVAIIGGLFGLLVIDALYTVYGERGLAILTLLPVIPLGIVIAYLFLPETAGRSLEEISPDRPPSHH